MKLASRLVASLIVACAVPATLAHAGSRTVYYQPTPYPADKPQGVHIVDGWVPSVYYGKTFQEVEKLRVGGWADYYNTYIRFDTRGLPAHVTGAQLQLSSIVNDVATTDYYLMLPAAAWDNTMTWDTQPSVTTVATYSAGAVPGWWNIPLTDIYNNWQGDPPSNFGVGLYPVGNNNQFDEFRSSRYEDDSVRPILALTFTPPPQMPNFKLPLPRKVAWLVTTEIGGWDCTGAYDAAHDNQNYFSVDFSWRNKNKKGKQIYGDPGEGAQIPILAAADGVVVAGNWTSTSDPNGYYVVLSHDVKHKITKGYSTRYLHLKEPPLVGMGDAVVQGTSLGFMGNTGQSDGDHLHFGIRYNNDGSATRPELTYVIISGWLMKSLQTECLAGEPNRYYMSQ